MQWDCTWMDLEGIMISEISQKEKDKYYMVSLICRIIKVKQDTEYNNKKKQSHRYREQTSSYQCRGNVGSESEGTIYWV